MGEGRDPFPMVNSMNQGIHVQMILICGRWYKIKGEGLDPCPKVQWFMGECRNQGRKLGYCPMKFRIRKKVASLSEVLNQGEGFDKDRKFGSMCYVFGLYA